MSSWGLSRSRKYRNLLLNRGQEIQRYPFPKLRDYFLFHVFSVSSKLLIFGTDGVCPFLLVGHSKRQHTKMRAEAHNKQMHQIIWFWSFRGDIQILISFLILHKHILFYIQLNVLLCSDFSFLLFYYQNMEEIK